MKNIIFDFDGVIGNTIPLFANYHKYKNPHLTDEQVAQDMINYFLEPAHSHQINPSADKLLKVSQWLSDFILFAEKENALPVPLFYDFINIVVKLNIPNKAIVSSGSIDYILPAISTSSLNPSHILGFEDHHSKEEKIKIICKDWGISTKEIIYFTDTIADILEVRDMVKTVIGCTWGAHSYDLLSTVLPKNQILKSFDDIYKLA